MCSHDTNRSAARCGDGGWYTNLCSDPGTSVDLCGARVWPEEQPSVLCASDSHADNKDEQDGLVGERNEELSASCDSQLHIVNDSSNDPGYCETPLARPGVIASSACNARGLCRTAKA